MCRLDFFGFLVLAIGSVGRTLIDLIFGLGIPRDRCGTRGLGWEKGFGDGFGVVGSYTTIYKLEGNVK